MDAGLEALINASEAALAHELRGWSKAVWNSCNWYNILAPVIHYIRLLS